MRIWLLEQHGFKTSVPSLCNWRKRKTDDDNETKSKTLNSGGFEIVVTAPGASSISVRVTPTLAMEARN